MKRSLFIIPAAVVIVAVLFLIFRNPAPKPQAEIPNPVTGLITHTSKDYITIMTNDGQEITFKNRQDVPLDHLIEHQEDDWAVSVTWQAEGQEKAATRLDDE